MTDIAEAIAHKLAAVANDRAGASWFWIESGGADTSERAYLGISQQVCVVGSSGEEELVGLMRATAATREASEQTVPYAAFSGGWVIALAYEFGAVRIPHDDEDDATMLALRVPAVIEVDHATGSARVLSEPGTSQALISVLQDCVNASAEPVSHELASPLKSSEPQWHVTDRVYAERIAVAQEFMRASDLRVLCLTNQAEVEFEQQPDPLTLFVKLRSRSRAPRAGLIVHGDEALISASPERFLELANGWIETAPMKGTRKRGATPDEDAALAEELGSYPKELAENRAVAELVRDEVARVSASGTAAITRDCEVLTFDLVHQLVSVVRGRLDEGHDLWSALAELFPGGSMTGAPKQRAISALGDLEPEARGWYSGCFGWISADGQSAQLAMTIRSIALSGTRAVVGAGGGVTRESVPAFEVDEMHLKADALLQVLR